MQLFYGNYGFDQNAITLASEINPLWNKGGQPYAEERRLTVHGYLSTSITGNSTNQQKDLSALENELKAALSIPYQNLVFRADDGTIMSDGLTNVGSITGVHIVRGPIFSKTDGPEFCTVRTFEFTASAEYPINGAAALLLSFTESLSFSGGGPIYAHRMAINGPPQKQLIYPASIYKVLQSGAATGYLAYPSAPPPKFPLALKESPNFVRKAPERRGNGYSGYELNWSYQFESATPLVALPTLWIK